MKQRSVAMGRSQYNPVDKTEMPGRSARQAVLVSEPARQPAVSNFQWIAGETEGTAHKAVACNKGWLPVKGIDLLGKRKETNKHTGEHR